MTDNTPAADDSKKNENELKLYTLLVDQLLKYQATIWQIPTALVIGNFLAIEKFLGKPIPLVALAAFNFGLIFVLHRMIKSQRRIIEATGKVEEKLRPIFGDLLPTFKKHKWPAPFVFVGILSVLEAGLVGYIVLLFLSSPQPVVTNARVESYHHKQFYHCPAKDSCAAHNTPNNDAPSVDRK